MSEGIYEVRWHARGGQGAVTASRFLSASASRENKHFQGFPEFGTERMGAAIQAFTRLSDSRIYTHEQVTSPNAVVVLDPTLLEVVDVTAGLMPGSPLIINSKKTPAEIKKELPEGDYKVYTVDADTIAREEVGRVITNTAMVGALVKVTNLVNFDAVKAELIGMFGTKFKKSVVDGNVKALERAYEEVKGE
ncbi:MAG: 2-oxoacid:acceptor oxidoreductase family protein [Actinobacteria bacterium]|nr:2-oxoacid:acceptor oxidoreductase family protein [Actinomycetota bacterium]